MDPSAAKNFEHVVVVARPSDYELVLRELHEGVSLDDVKAKTGCAFGVALGR